MSEQDNIELVKGAYSARLREAIFKHYSDCSQMTSTFSILCLNGSGLGRVGAAVGKESQSSLRV
jgi:hypothetical protein